MFSNISIASNGQAGPVTRQPVENGVVHLAERSKVLLEVSPDAIAGYSKDSTDLLVTLKSGETLRIANFYAAGQPASELFLFDKDQVVAVDLAEASDGTLVASYLPQEGMAGFESLTATGGDDDGLSTGALVLLGALAAGGAGVAIHNHNSGGGGGGGGGEITPEPRSPVVATDLQISLDGTLLTGKTEAGSTVKVDIDGDGAADLTVVAGADGQFEVPLEPPLVDGEIVSVVVVQHDGSDGPVETVQAPDYPDIPQIDPTNGTVLTGTAEAGIALIITDGDGNLIGQTTADSQGNWTFTPTTPLAHDTEVNVVAKSAKDLSSAPATTIVDALAPDVPTIEPSNGSVLLGTAEAGAKVILTDGSGNAIGETTADASGNWTFTPASPLANATVVNAVARDAVGNTSPQASTTVDSVAPVAPTIDASNGTILTGTAEAGTRVILTRENGQLTANALVADSNATVIGETTADANGNWTFTPATRLPHGLEVHVVSEDAAGNVSDRGSTTIDAVAPAAPLINPSNGTLLVGTAEAGSTVILSNGNGQVIGQVKADSSGNWSHTPATPLANGTVVNAVARDAVGNTSPQATITIDSVAPAAPLIAPSNGTLITGTAEAGANVIISDSSGQVIGETTANSSGNWSFTPATPLANGAQIQVVARDAVGNTSAPTTAIIDALAPTAPVINLSNGSVLMGTAEAGAKVILTTGNGQPLAQVNADSNGNWSYTPATPLANGTVVHAVARDAAGNTSPQTTTTVDSVAPAAPLIEPSNGTVLTGTAEAGSKLILTLGNGSPLGEVIVGGNGQWTFSPNSPLANGTVVHAVARDAVGNTSPQATTTIDSIAPAAPLIEPTNGSVITGTAEPGASITLTDGSGNPIGQTTTDSSGHWSFTPSTLLADGTVVRAVATDAAGNTSAPGMAVVDGVAPAAPTVDISNGSALTGTAEPNSNVIISNGNGQPIGEVTADGSGNWAFTPATPLPNGTVVNVVAQDAAGNVSPPASTTIDSQAPAAPLINPSNGTEISGTAEAGSIVKLTLANGTPLAQITADGNGNWSFTPGTPLANGTVVRATATDAAGNVSPSSSTTIDSVAPEAPAIDPSNGTVISGTAEAGSKIILTDGSGNPIGETTTGSNGEWTFTPATPLPDGTVIEAVAQDPAGNTSLPASTVVDAVAPPAPVINPTNGEVINGSAEPNSTVTLTEGDGNPLGQTTADNNGDWSFTPGTPLGNGTEVNATATDAAGNTSAPGSIIVDTSLPSIPVIDPSNGSVISGTADAGNTVILTDGDNNPIGQVTADGSGNWSFTPGVPLADGTVVNAVARNPAGIDSAPATITIDGVAPAAPTIDPTNGIALTGTAEAGTTITLTSAGTPIGQTTADANGDWAFTPGTPLPDGTVVNAVATDAAGNTSPPASVTVDAVAPAQPVVDPSNGLVITGTAEAGSKLIITDGDGNPVGSTTADGGGNWTFAPLSPIADGTVITVVAQDAAGNTSAPVSTTIDAIAPDSPVIAPSNGSLVSGTAEAGATVILTDGAGNPIGQVTADGGGNWSFIPATPLANGSVINAVARDAVGNTSGPASTTVDSVAPATPLLDPSNGTEISGTAEAGAAVILTDGSGNPIGQVTADGNGDWSFTPTTPLPDGTVINAVAQDAAGNTSAPATTTVDAVAPAAPVINPSNGTEISGTAEPGSTVIITDGAGNSIGSTTVDGNGDWSFTPATPLPDGTVIDVAAQDAAGNTGPSATVTVDAVAPAAPVINPSNGTEISGTAEPGSTVIITDGAGNSIGSSTVDGNGDWSFTPATPLPDGTVINGVVEDAAGNTSPPTSSTVDAVAPAAPVINPSNGTVISGTAEEGATLIITDGAGNPIGSTTADGNGDWTFTPATPLPDGTVINGVAEDVAGNTSLPATTTVDALAPPAPVINPSNGTVVSGTAEVNAKIILTDGNGNPMGEATADGAGNWSFTPGTPLADGTVVNAVAQDAAGNTSPPASTTVDAVAPPAPVLSISADGALLTGTAEANTQVRVTIAGNPTPLTVNVDGSGNFSLPLLPALIAGELLTAVAVDAAGNVSPPTDINAPDLAAPVITVPEAADGWVNAVEIGSGIQVNVAVRPTMQVGQVINVKFAGQNGYELSQSHVLTASDISAGEVVVTLEPAGGMGEIPEGASMITADTNGGADSNSVNFVVDTIAPATPVLSLVGSLLTISAEPGTELTVSVNLAGVVATVTVTADNAGLASLNLLTDLDIDLSWDQLLTAQVSVVGHDPAGNPSNVATLGIGPNLAQPVTIGNLGLDVALLPPTLGLSGQASQQASLEVQIVTPALTVTVAPPVDTNGNFGVNLLDPSLNLLGQLGLSLSGLLNLGAGLSFNVLIKDSHGNVSSSYGIGLTGSGLGLSLGQITVNGTAGDDILSGTAGRSEHINSGDGHDLIRNVGSGDQVDAGSGNDTIEVVDNDFASIDGGDGFDTLLLAGGIDIDYNGAGVGTLRNIERIDMGTGDSGSDVTLTAAEVDVITDDNNTLQITGETNDTLHVAGAVNTGTTQQINGLTYDVYTFGSTTLLVEENTVQVVA